MGVKDIIKPQGGSHSPGKQIWNLKSQVGSEMLLQAIPEEGVLNSA